MKRYNLFHLFFLFFGLLASTSAYAVEEQDIDATNNGFNTPKTLTFIIDKPRTVQIHIANPTGSVFWGFGSVTFPGCGPAAGETYTCGGITITLPATSTSTEVPPTLPATVTWSGSGPVPGSSFRLDIGDGSFNRTYILEFKQPLDVFFVLDKSGSMSAITEGTTTRIDALKVAVNGFMGRLSNPAFTGNSDQVGLNFFDTSVTPPSFGAGLIPLNPASATTIFNALSPVVASGATAMGAGINDAKSRLTDVSHTRNMILFTDGDQTEIPKVSDSGQDVGGVNINPTYPAPVGSLRVSTIGIGSPSLTFPVVLGALALANRGQCLLTSNGTNFTNTAGTPVGDIGGAFIQAFINLLRDSSPQLVQYRSGTVNNGQTMAAFSLNRNVEDLVIEIQLNKRFEIPTLAQIIGSIRVQRNGLDVTALAVPQWVGNFTDTYLLAFSFNSERARAANLQSDGKWVVSVIANSPAQGSTYRTAVIADDHLLDYTCAQSLSKPRVGNSQRFSTNLTYLGKPIDNARVSVAVYKPGSEIGDLLARHPLKVVLPRQSQDKSSVGILKYQTLLARDPAFVKALIPTETIIPLANKGGGVYEADFNNLDLAGIYQLLFRIQSTDSIFGTIDRVEMQSMYVQPAPIDLGKSVFVRRDLNGQSLITVTPVTTTGKFLGPAATDVFDVNAQLTKLTNIADNQDGSYTLTLRGDAKAVGTINVLKQKVFSGRFADIRIRTKVPPVVGPITTKPPVLTKPPVITRPPVTKPPVIKKPVLVKPPVILKPPVKRVP